MSMLVLRYTLLLARNLGAAVFAGVTTRKYTTLR